MFGPKIDYYLLKPFTHAKGRATEAELDAAAQTPDFSREDARAYLRKVVNTYFDGQLRVDPKSSYLDIGCGMGRLCFGLVDAGATDVVGIDVVPRHIQQAKVIAAKLGMTAQPNFSLIDANEWQTDRTYDTIMVLGVMEHIKDPRNFLKRLPSLIRPGGRAFIGHEPFQSPIGDHMQGFFRIPIPWRGVLFAEEALMRLRREYFRPTDPAECFADIVGGLNQMSYSAFVQNVRDAGLKIAHAYFNPQLKRLKPAHVISEALTHLPVVSDYFITNAYVVLERA